MLMDPISFDRMLIAGVLASLAVAIAFGPELGRALARLRNRRVVDDVSASQSLGAEPQQF
jgi:pilus assembly protein TadC